MSIDKGCIGVVMIASCFSLGYASTDTHVVVSSGQVLGESELVSGSFMGQSFSLTPDTFFDIDAGGVIGPTPSSTVDQPFDFGGSTINLFNGGQYSVFLDPMSYATSLNLNASTGSVVFDLYLSGPSSVLNVDGGAIFLGSASEGTTVNMTAGTVASGYSISQGSVFNFSGGTMGGLFHAVDQSIVNMNGGTIGINFRLFEGSELNLSNGIVQDGFISQSGSEVHIDGGMIQNQYSAGGTMVYLSGGSIGDEYRTFHSETILTGGDIGNGFWADSGSTVNMSSGSIGNDMIIGPELFFGQYVVANVSGGSIGDRLTLRSRGVLNLYGGSVGDELRANIGSEVNLFVEQLSIDGKSIELEENSKTIITTRGGALLEAILADGSYIDFTLNGNFVAGEDLIDGSAILSVTLVPTPGYGFIIGMGSLSLSRRRRV